MNARSAPWHSAVSTSTTDAEYFRAAPAAVTLRLRPHDAKNDPEPMTGTWCPLGMKLVTLAHRSGTKALFWVASSASFAIPMIDDDIAPLLFCGTAKPCPAA